MENRTTYEVRTVLEFLLAVQPLRIPNSSNFKGFSLAERLLPVGGRWKGRWGLSIITQRLYVLLRRPWQRAPFAGRRVLRGKHSTAAEIA